MREHLESRKLLRFVPVLALLAAMFVMGGVAFAGLPTGTIPGTGAKVTQGALAQAPLGANAQNPAAASSGKLAVLPGGAKINQLPVYAPEGLNQESKAVPPGNSKTAPAEAHKPVSLAIPKPLTPGTCDTAGPIEVESSGGVTAPTPYGTLGLAFTAINNGVHTGAINIDVCGNPNEPTTATLNASGTGSASYTSVNIIPAGGAPRTISGSIDGAPLIDLNGADNVTIDGLNTGGNALTLINTSASATAGTSTVTFIGGATGNTLVRLTILGSATMAPATAGGTVYFGTDTVAATGNDTNTVALNNIGPWGTNLPSKGIFGLGTTTTQANENSSVVLNSNNIYDYFGTGATSTSGIYVGAGNDNWIIFANRLYQTAPRTFTTTALRYAGITLSTGSTNPGAFTLTANTIGFGAANGTGVTTITGSSNEIRGIDAASTNTVTPTSIQGNIISGFNQTSSRTSTTSANSAFIGIPLGTTGGIFNVGTVTGNTIGSLDGSSTIVVNSTATAATAPVIGIYDFSFSNSNIANNNIGAITIQGTATTVGFRGILVSGLSTLTTTILNNIIGGPTSAGAITDSEVGAYAMYGMQIGSDASTIIGNTIRNLNGNATTAGSIIVAGIVSSASTAANTFTSNNVYSLTNASGTASNSIYAIYCSFGTAANLVQRNFVHNLSITSTAATAQLAGILAAAGSGTYQNNMVSLGTDPAGNPITAGVVMYGYFEIAGTNNFYFNDSYIGGTGVVAATSNTFAFVSNVVTTTRSYLDNIFYNARSNAVAGGAAHVAIFVGGTTNPPAGLTSNYNDLYVSGTDGAIGVYNGFIYPTLAAWQAATSEDLNSISADPLFVAPAGSAATTNLHVQVGSPIESAGLAVASVTDDFDGENRASLTPTDIGADAGNFAVPTATSTSTNTSTSTSTNTATNTSTSTNTATSSSTTTSTSTGTSTPTRTSTATNSSTSTATTVPSTTRTSTTVAGTATATSTCTNPLDYTIASSNGATLVPGVLDIGNHGDDVGTTINLPFPVTLYDQTFTTTQPSSNGSLSFGIAYTSYDASCLPNSANGSATYTIAPFWVDQRTDCTGCGIYTSTTGVAPNRTFNIEYRTIYYGQSTSSAPTLDYEVQLFEGQISFNVIYGTVSTFAAADSGLSIAVQKNSTTYKQYACTTAGAAPPVASGQQLTFTGICNVPTATQTGTATQTPVCPPAGWTQEGAYPITIADEAVASQGTFLYSFGGVSNSVNTANSYKYNAATNTWTAIASLPQALQGASAVSDGTYIYILNGANSGGTVQNVMYRYDPVANTYTTMAAPTIATFAQAAAYLNGKIYRISGCTTPCTAATGTVEIYTISSNSWATSASAYPTPGGFLMAVASGGFIYAGGGTFNGTYTPKTYRYDPTSDTWNDAAVTDLPISAWGAATGVLTGRWLVGPGASSGSIGNYLYALDLSNPTGAWTTLANAPVGEYRESGGVIGNNYYAVGGSPFTGTTNNQRYTDAACVTPSATSSSTTTVTATASSSTTGTTVPSVTSTNTSTPPITATTTSTVASISTSTATATATCPVPLNYNYTLTTGVIVPGATRIDGVGCDDCTTTTTLPFAFNLYGTTYTSAAAGSNGILAFGTANNTFAGGCFPVATATYQMMPFFRDQRTDNVSGCVGCGIYTATTGTAPNRIFSIEYRTTYFGETSTVPTLDYEVNLYESGAVPFDYTYGLVNTTTQTGRMTSIGVQRDTTVYRQFACDPSGQTPPVTTGQRITWTLASCAISTATTTSTSTATTTGTATNTTTGTATRTATGTATGTATTTVTATASSTATSTAVNTGTATATATCSPGGFGGPWSVVTPLPGAVYGNRGDSDGTYYYSVGGSNIETMVNTVYRYDPVANSYATMAPVPTAVQDGSVVYYSGKLYVFGGLNSLTNAVYTSTQIYNISTDTWSMGAPMPAPRFGSYAGVFNGKMYVAGGYPANDVSTSTNTTYEYNVGTNTWTTKATMPNTNALGASKYMGQYLYTFGGWRGNPCCDGDSYRYDMAADVWTTLTSMPTGLEGAAASLVNGNIWIYGGGTPFSGGKPSTKLSAPDGVQAINTTYVYNPTADSYTTGPTLNQPRTRFAGGNVGNRSIAVAGYTGSTVTASTEISLILPGNCPTGTATRTSTATVTNTVTSTASPSSTTTASVTRTTTFIPSATGTITAPPSSTSTTTSTATNTASTVPSSTSAPTHTATNTATLIPTGTRTNTTVPSSTSTGTASPTQTGQVLPGTQSPSVVPSTATATATTCVINYTDVHTYDPFYKYIQCLTCRGIVSGFGDGTFRPNAPVTRGQASKMIANAAGFQEAVSGQSFPDVHPGDTYYVYIERLAQRHLIGGFPDGTFRPNQSITRGQLAKIDSNAAGFSDTPPQGTQSFTDVLPGSTYYLYIERLSMRGIISGYKCGEDPAGPCDAQSRPYYLPETNITRGQTTKIVANTFFPVDCAPGRPQLKP